MKLSYRGIPYNSHFAEVEHSCLKTREARAAYNLKYRGVPYSVPHAQPAPAPGNLVPRMLIYRGISYLKWFYQAIIK